MPSVQNTAYSLGRTLALWLAVTLPTALMAWGVVPFIVAHSHAAPIVVSLLALTIGSLWTSFVGWWTLRRDGVSVRGKSLDAALGLRPPAASANWIRLGLLGLLAIAMVAYVPLVLWHASAVFGPFMVRTRAVRKALDFSARLQADYVPPSALADPALAHAYWLVPLALLAWGLNALVAEEVFFRGLLLPRLQDRQGRGRIGVNALLYFAYCLATRPFAAPARLVWGIAAAWLTRRTASIRPVLILRAVEGLVVAAFAILAVTAQPLPSLMTAPSLPHIARQPKPTVWWDQMRRVRWATLPKYDRGSSDPWQLDLRGKDLSEQDFNGRAPDLLMSTFDATTVWPKRLPAGFTPREVIDLGANPGLGVRRLHARGITGRGVGIGIIDTTLLTTHVEIASQLRWYEEITTGADNPTHMHGSAVSSIAVGQSLGVAPNAGLYFIAIGINHRMALSGDQLVALGVRRLVEVNRWLAAIEKIRVISISQRFSPGKVGYLEIKQAIRLARSEGIFVIYCSMEDDTPLGLHGLGRDALADPEQVDSYQGPVLLRPEHFLRWPPSRDRLLAPMDSRTTASPTGKNHYVFYRHGGMSWVAPYLAGLYALALQVDPRLTGQQFWALALKSGHPRTVEVKEKRLPFGHIVDPETLIEAISPRRQTAAAPSTAGD